MELRRVILYARSNMHERWQFPIYEEEKMIRVLIALVFIIGLATMYGCETVNKGAEKGGEAVGKVMRVPNSASSGAAEGLRGKPQSNPYKR